MTKRDLLELVSRKAHVTKKTANEVVDVFLEEIGRVMGKGEKRVVISGFGTFRWIWMDTKTVKIPNTDKNVTIKRHRLPKFTPGKSFRDQVNH